ncbi:putative benzyl alcohol O-benzoyltransferase [Dioscorea sansibarensis]
MASSSLSSFSVKRQAPVLITPPELTPRELKPLSDIDDQTGLRFEMPALFFYRAKPAMAERDPAKVIGEALSKSLVFYYPFAGRVREGPGQKLFVDCTGEGVVFVEGDANVRLDDFGDELPPPVHVLNELIHDVEGSSGVLNCPIFLIQVTRLLCGGFILAIRLNHTMCDASGLVLFLKSMADIARGATSPSVPPVWSRQLLTARNPPCITHTHLEYQKPKTNTNTASVYQTPSMVDHSLFFGPKEMSALRKHVPPHLRQSSAFEILIACLWRSRTIALKCQNEEEEDEEVRIIYAVNTRNKYRPALPKGYYGNALAFVAAISKADELCRKPLGYALELVKKAKDIVTDEYMRSVTDMLVLNGRPQLMTKGGYLVSDLTRIALRGIDLGWGEAVYGGPGKGSVGDIPGFSSFFISYRNSKGEDGTVVPVSLPPLAMQRFLVEIQSMIMEPVATAYLDDFDHGYAMSKL